MKALSAGSGPAFTAQSNSSALGERLYRHNMRQQPVVPDRVHQKGGGVENGKITPISQQQRIGRTKRTACLKGDRSRSAENGPVNMAAENAKWWTFHRFQKLKKCVTAPASELIQHLYADLERWLMHKDENGCPRIGKRAS